MQLLRLELKGFKSFADKTIVKFSPGMTAVIGPNGSGKSNITDAMNGYWENPMSVICAVKKQRILFSLVRKSANL